MENVQDIDKKLQIAENAFKEWKEKPFNERQKLFAAAVEILKEKSEEFGKLITKEMGKPISQAIGEVEKCATMVNFYANVTDVLKPEKIKTKHQMSEVHYAPMGIILGVMPWNYPFWQALRFAVPAILAGNTVVLKHASICFGSGNAIEKLLLEAGFPKGIFQNLEVGHEAVEHILEYPAVQGVSLTGSEPAGAKVAATAAKNIKKSVLELGGSDAFIILEDADLNKAAKAGALARLQNGGQTCIAAKRFVLHEKIEKEFMPKFIEEYKKFTPGDPMDKDTKIAGMARPDLADDLEKQYEFAKKHGAEVILPLKKINKDTFEPGLIKVKQGNPILEQELFGPLGMILIGKDDDDCIAIANSTKFGLGNSLWTKDKKHAIRLADQLESGAVAINQMLSSMPEMPFGGAKHSGFGTELSLVTLKEFTIPKSIVGSFGE